MYSPDVIGARIAICITFVYYNCLLPRSRFSDVRAGMARSFHRSNSPATSGRMVFRRPLIQDLRHCRRPRDLLSDPSQSADIPRPPDHGHLAGPAIQRWKIRGLSSSHRAESFQRDQHSYSIARPACISKSDLLREPGFSIFMITLTNPDKYRRLRRDRHSARIRRHHLRRIPIPILFYGAIPAIRHPTRMRHGRQISITVNSTAHASSMRDSPVP